MQPSRLQRSTEYYGLGQSGYTAGRVEGDPSLAIEGRNLVSAKGVPDTTPVAVDERFTGTGGRHWAPDAAAA